MYLDFYGLKENPFNGTSDPSFLYLSRPHKEALSHLLYGINAKKGFLEITGEVGAGKTTLCKALLNQLGDDAKTAFILNPNLSELQLLEMIVEDFGIRPERRSKVSLLRQLNRFLLEELRKRSTVVLILDEAQDLKNSTLEAVRLLSNLETDKEKLFQIVLVGQPELRDKLKSPSLLQVSQRIGVRFHISPLQAEETEKYVYHRLKIAGSDSDIYFTKEALDKIFEFSKGIPRLINLLCDKALLLGFVLGVKNIDGEIVDKSIFEIEGVPQEVRI